MSTPILDEEAIFQVARKIDAAEARSLYLRQVCGSEPGLQARVEALLRVHDQERSFLEAPPEGVRAPDPVSVAEGPGTVIGPYKLLEQIGEGGFGVVFMAEQQQPIHRRVALKVIKPGMDTKQVVARFEAERQALALMDHPNIAHVLDGGPTASGRPYFVMELVRGAPITEFCDQKRLSVRQRLELFKGICHAVQHAHQKGIIHRDIKPSNVLITLHDGTPVVKVIDFGVAKAMGQRLTDKTLFTHFVQMVGTPLYMSPEQAELSGLDIDTRSDIYSLGVLLYELLTGTTPFERERLKTAAFDEIRRIIREEEPARPSTRISTIGAAATTASGNRQTDPRQLTRLLRGELDWIVMKCLEKDRTRRYETANGLARDVQRYLNGELVEACPPSAGYRLRKLVTRHRKLLGMVGIVAMLLCIATGISLALAFRATKAEQVAGEERDKALAEKERADEEAAIARVVNEFLQKSLLSQADIGNQPLGMERNKNLTVRELLDRAAQRIGAEFTGQERTEAAIQRTIGMTYQALGDYPQAYQHLERALALRKDKFGAGQYETLQSTNELAVVWWQWGQPDKAEPLFQEALEGLRALRGSEHPDTLGILMNLAALESQSGRHRSAEERYQQAIAGFRQTLGFEHPKTLQAMGNYAHFHTQRGRYTEAANLTRQVIDGLRIVHGHDHPATLWYQKNLGLIYLQDRKYDRAEQELLKVLSLMRAKLGEGHPHTLSATRDLATVYLRTKRLDDAHALFVPALALSREKLGSNHTVTQFLMDGTARVLHARERFEDAEALFKEVLQARRAALPDDHPDTLMSIHNLGVFYLQRTRYIEAEPLLLEATTRARKRLGPRHPETQHYLRNLAAVYTKQGQTQLAEPLLRELAELKK